jgi:predicted transcriptional regulator of viral defense system
MEENILHSFEPFPYFTIESINQMRMVEQIRESSIRTALYRWVKAGRVVQLKKGVYMTRRFYEQHRSDADFSMMVSSILTPHSYISLEFILQRNSILTEVTYPVSAVTSKNTHVIENALGIFNYRHVKEPIYRGFSISEYSGVPFGVASVAKALFDYLYLRNWSGVKRSADFNLAEELRLSLDDFRPSEQIEFGEYVRLSRSRTMEWVLDNLKRNTWRT